VFGSIANKVTRFEPGKEVAPGITSIAAYGHTPGHTAFAIASGNQSIMTVVDVTNNAYLFVRHPEWQVAFDTDGALAVETRKRLLDRAAADKMLVSGYHWPFPAVGYITKEGSGYRLNPVACATCSEFSRTPRPWERPSKGGSFRGAAGYSAASRGMRAGS
jgi:glyoxylase-like metal-dependent hydrolase (beta-lactamase superfamily II)